MKKMVLNTNIIGFLRTDFNAWVPWYLNKGSLKNTSQKDPQEAMIPWSKCFQVNKSHFKSRAFKHIETGGTTASSDPF